MADNILRLKVESQEYDSKLKRAAEGLQRYADQCHKAGGTLEFVEKETLEYVRALGQMGTTATTTRGKLEEMTKAFTEFSHVYNQMSSEEKRGDFGKSLNASLSELKGRIQDSRKELDDINKSIKGSDGLTGSLDAMLGKVGLNVNSLLKFGGAAGAASTALKVAKDAFNSSQTNIDEWNRTIVSAESLYSSFLNALNNSDISGFLTRMDDIVEAARKAYNAMSDLQMYTAFNQRNVAKGQAEYQKALDEYKLNPTADNKSKLSQANQQVIAELKVAQSKTEILYKEALGKIAANNIKDKNLQAKFVEAFANGSYEDFQAAGAAYKSGKGLNAGAQYFYGDRVYDGRIQDRSTGKWREMSGVEKEQFEFARAIAQVTKDQTKEVQALGAQSLNIEKQIAQQDRMYNRMAGNNGKPGGGGRGGGGINEIKTEEQLNTERIQKLTQEYVLASKERQNAIRGEIQTLKERNAQIQQLKDEASGKAGTLGMVSTQIPVSLVGPIADIETKMKSMSGVAINSDGENPFEKYKDSAIGLISPLQQLDDELKRLQEEQMKTWSPEQFAAYSVRIKEVQEAIGNFKGVSSDANKMAKAWQTASSAINTAGSAMSSLKNPAIDVMTVIAQSIASVALAYSQTLAQDKTSKSNIWAFIAAAAAATVSMATTISQIHSATGYAEGGEIKGNSFSGDNLMAMGPNGLIGLNAGELVLNASQQQTLASNLQNNGGGNFRLVGKLAGEDIILSAERAGKRMGYGQLMFWNGN